MASDLRKCYSEDDLPTAPWRFPLSFIPVATNLRTGLDLRTGPSCCENTNLRTGPDWTSGPGNQWHVAMGYNKRSTTNDTNETVQYPHTRLGDHENDTWDELL